MLRYGTIDDEPLTMEAEVSLCNSAWPVCVCYVRLLACNMIERSKLHRRRFTTIQVYTLCMLTSGMQCMNVYTSIAIALPCAA